MLNFIKRKFIDIIKALSGHNKILFFAIQNSTIIGLVYFNYIGVSRYAAGLNILHITIIWIIAAELLKFSSFKYIKIISFTAVFIFQILNALLLSSFAMGMMFLGMPFEYEMVVTHLATPSEFMLNYGIDFPSIFFLILLIYIVYTSYILSFRTKYNFSNSQNLKVLAIILFLLALCLLPLSLSREPFLLTVFGHGFDGAPKDIYKKQLWPKTNFSNEKLEKIEYRPIVFISIDAARGDILNPKSPDIKFLYELNRKGKIRYYENSYSICTVTYCGMLGSLGSSYWDSLLTNGPNLQDYLSSVGYHVNFILSGDHSRYHGLRKMFGNNISRYYDGTMVSGNPNDDDNIIKWIEASEIDSRTFLYIHLMSMHVGGVLKNRETLVKNEISSDNKDDMNYFFKSRYMHAARQADSYIETIFSILDKKGILGDAIIIISADHGEMLGEKGEIGHSAKKFPYDPAIRIPLIIYDQRRNYPDRTVSSQIDIAPTLIRAINGTIPSHWNGIPLQLTTKRCAIRSDTNAFQTYIGFIEGIQYKYVKYNNAEFAFNLTTDPTEISPMDSYKDIEKTRQALAQCINVQN
jgi:hypothetical protein